MHDDINKVTPHNGKFKPGQKRPAGAGRRAGTPNKRTRMLEDIFGEFNFDPAQRLCQLMSEFDKDKQAEICMFLMDFIYPRRKVSEISHVDEAERGLIDREIGDIMARPISEK